MSFNLLRGSAFFICVLSCCSYLISQTSEESAQRVPFCTLRREKDRYKDSLITLRVKVTSFKHGALISDPSCPKQGMGLLPKQSAVGAPSVSHFYQFLQERRLSKTPIFATITGRLSDAESDNTFVKWDLVFRLESVSEVSEGDQGAGPPSHQTN
jgi:hypothetical protein